MRFIYNRDAQRKLADLLDAFQPDIVHLHNYYHQLSTSILCPIRQRNIPVVQTLHDYHLIDPTYKLFSNGRIFEDTQGGKEWKIIPERSIQGSFWASLLEAIESVYSRTRGGSWTTPDRFIAPSEFLRKKCIEFGVPAEKITTLPYTFIPARHSGEAMPTPESDRIPDSPQARRNDGKSILYAGRLDDEKGVDVLLRAMAKLPDIHLDIVGDGPSRKKLQRLAINLHLRNVTFVGWKSAEEIREYYDRCAFLVVPSLWYEVFGLVILEAAQHRKPTIASRIGGIPEVLEDGKQGLLVAAGNVEQLAQRIAWLAEHPNEQRRMGNNAYEGLERFNSREHWEMLEKMYHEVIQTKSSIE